MVMNILLFVIFYFMKDDKKYKQETAVYKKQETHGGEGKPI